MCATLGILAAIVAGMGIVSAQEIMPAVAMPPADEPAGEPPADILGREVFPDRTVALDDLSGWTLELSGEAQGELVASRERVLWSDLSARLVISGNEGMLRMVPPDPIALNDGWDSVTLWAYMWNESWRRSIAGPFAPQVLAQVADASGEIHTLSMPRITAAGVKRHWNLWQAPRAAPDWAPSVLLGDVADISLDRDVLEGATHLHSGGDRNGQIDGAGEFVALLVQPPQRMIDSQIELFLDSVSFHQAPQPEIEHFAAGDVPGVLEETVTPPPPAGVTCEVSRGGDAFIFRSSGEDGVLEFRYEPSSGTLSDITASWNDGEALIPMSGGGLSLAPVGEIGRSVESAELLECALDEGTVRARFRLSAAGAETEVRYALRAIGRALEIEIAESAGMATRLDFGHVEGAGVPRSISVPYMVLDGRAIFRCNEPRVVLADGLFIGGMLDWHRSDAAQWLGSDRAEAARFMGGCSYEPLTSGNRRPLRETIYVAVSPNFHEVLPKIPHQASQNRAVFADHYYFMTGSPYPGFVEMNDRFGLERCIYNHHGSTWAAVDENHFMSPRVRKDMQDTLPRYVESLHESGHLFGLIMMYTGLSPMSELWDEARVAVQPGGYWQFDWFNLYSADHPWLVDVHARQEAEIHDLYDTDLYYYDTHTARDPANPVNFRARADGAGTARSVWESSARIFATTRDRGRFSISEGRRRWLYAGLVDADYGTLEGHAEPWQRQPLVDFDLLRLHPLGVTVGNLNFYGYGADGPPEGHPALTGEGFDQQRAFAVAFGHCVMQHGIPLGAYSDLLEEYYLMSPVQRRLAATDVDEITYFDGRRFLDTSDALRADVVKGGLLRLRYEGGIEVHVNYAAESDWLVESGGREWTLPPFGWVVSGPDLLAFCARIDGAMVQYARDSDRIFMDTGDARASFDGLTMQGSAVVTRKMPVEVMPVGGYGKLNVGSPLWRDETEQPSFAEVAEDRGCAVVVLGREALGLPDGTLRIDALSDEGGTLQFADFGMDEGGVTIRPGPDAMKYILTAEEK